MKKQIKDFPNYTICIDGTVTNTVTGKIKKPYLGKTGYYSVELYANGYSKKLYLHRILAEHFIDNNESKRTVNHIDGNKLNNSISNLEWATDSENIKHAYDNNLNYSSTKKITETDIINIYNRVLSGDNMTTIIKDYPFSLSTCSQAMTIYLNKNTDLRNAFNNALKEQKLIRAKVKGTNCRNTIVLHMIDLITNETVKVFSSLVEAKEYLNKKSSGPIANVLAGRQKTAYGYYWKTL